MQSIIIRELVKFPEKTVVILGTSIALSFFAGLVTYFVLIAVVLTLDYKDESVLFLAIIQGASFIFDTLRVLSFYYEAKVESYVVARVTNYSTLITALLKFACVYFDLGIYILALVFILDVALIGIFLVFVFSRNVKRVNHLTFDVSIARGLLKDSLPMIFSGFMIGLYMKVDQVLVNGMLGNRSSGIFAISVRLTELFYFVPVILQSTLFPGIMAAKSDPILFRRRLDSLYSLTIVFSYTIIVVMFFSSSWLINVLYGPTFSDAVKPLMVSVFTLLFVSLGTVRNAYILSQNRTQLLVYITVLGLILNLVLNYLFIPWLGVLGASFAMLLSQLVAGFLSGFLLKELRSDFFRACVLLVWPRLDLKVYK